MYPNKSVFEIGLSCTKAFRIVFWIISVIVFEIWLCAMEVEIDRYFSGPHHGVYESGKLHNIFVIFLQIEYHAYKTHVFHASFR